MSGELRLSGVSVRRAGRSVLSEITLSVSPGAVLVVIGPNGSGKSTLSMVASGLLAAQQGAITIDGQPVAAMPSAVRARTVAYVPQRTDLIAPLPVSSVVAMGRYAHGEGGGLGRVSAATSAVIAECLHQVDAVHLGDRLFSELSGGETQRVLIARALATGAPVLVLDEPTSALDIAHMLSLLRLVRQLAARGKTVLVALHDLNQAHAIADHVALLQDGRIAEQGTADAVIAAEPIRRVYGVDLLAGGGFGYRLTERTPQAEVASRAPPSGV